MKNIVKILMFLCLSFIFVITSCSDSGIDPIVTGPVTDLDTDKDGVIDKMDNCVKIKNTDQSDVDNDGIGDVCDPVDGITTLIKSDYAADNYTYPITISFPEAFRTNKNLPIIYVLDGVLNLPNVQKNIDPNTPVITVGIGDLASKEEWLRRWVDLHPSESKCSGGKGKHHDFYNFITKQVIPGIENKHGIKPSSRTLVGHSSAGLFSLVAMFMQDTENVMFHNFIASDPELGCDPEYFTKLLDDNDFSNVDKKFKLYLNISIDGDIDIVRQFSADLQAKEYTWLTYKYEEFLNEGHMSVVEPSFKSGLKFVFNE